MWSNRAACLLRLGRHDKALQDAQIARTLDPRYVKVGVALRWLHGGTPAGGPLLARAAAGPLTALAGTAGLVRGCSHAPWLRVWLLLPAAGLQPWPPPPAAWGVHPARTAAAVQSTLTRCATPACLPHMPVAQQAPCMLPTTPQPAVNPVPQAWYREGRAAEGLADWEVAATAFYQAAQLQPESDEFIRLTKDMIVKGRKALQAQQAGATRAAASPAPASDAAAAAEAAGGKE